MTKSNANAQPANVPADHENRQRILHDLDVNVLVEAAAGTGKTTNIVGRMVNLIAFGKCEIGTLAAVTFTRKAAAELRERFHSQLRAELVAATRPAEELKRIQVAIDAIEEGFVGTFHSFCSLLLKERPIEFGVDPAFRELEDAEDLALRQHAWQDFLKVLYGDNERKLLDQIQELGLATSDLQKCFARFVEFPDVQQWPHQEAQPLDLALLKQQVKDKLDEMAALAPSFPVERHSDKLMDLYERLLRANDNCDWNVRGQFFDLLEKFDTSPGATLKYWHNKDVAKQQRDSFTEFRLNVVQPALTWWRQHRYSFLIQLLTQAREIYDMLRRASGGLDFQDLILRSAAGLREQPLLRSYFRQRFTHLLVDEFQDTDPVQAELLAYLTSTNQDETDWQQCVPRPGSLFLVGDPKQSIYRFRRADITTYQQVKKIFEQTGGEILTLSQNFRSVGEILDWVNPAFDQLFGKGSAYSPAAVPMEVGRTDAEVGLLRGVRKLAVPPFRQAEAAEAEAEQIARFIQRAINDRLTVARTAAELGHAHSKESTKTTKEDAEVKAGDFLIIAHNKKYLHVYAKALDALGIKNEVTGSNAFESVPELSIILDCLKAIDDPKNPIPYVSVLRGELFGFGDADLYALKKAGGRFSYTAALPEGLEASLHQRYASANARLARYQRLLRSQPFTSAFANIASDLGLLARCSTYLDGGIVAGGFLKAIEWLRAQSWNFDSATDVITYLEEMIYHAETETCNVHAQQGSCVRIMNLHKAKGLEAPVVFLAGTGGKREFDPLSHIDRRGSVTKGYLAIVATEKVSRNNGFWQNVKKPIAIPADWEDFQDEEVRFEDAEKTRLLYVAATRAKSLLVISYPTGDKKNHSHWQPLEAFLEDVKELKIGSPKDPPIPVAGETPQPSVSLPTLSEFQNGLQAAWQTVRTPTYAVVSAKTMAMQQSSRPTWRATGEYGADWGTVVHKLLEARMTKPGADLSSFAMQLSSQFDLGTERIGELIATVDSVTSSDIWARALAAKQRYVEIPFESAANVPAASLPTITRGVIDLCFEEPAGWVIVDYKSDDLTAADVDAAVGHYRPQLQAYVDFWTTITGSPVCEAGLYFTKLSEYRAI